MNSNGWFYYSCSQGAASLLHHARMVQSCRWARRRMRTAIGGTMTRLSYAMVATHARLEFWSRWGETGTSSQSSMSLSSSSSLVSMPSDAAPSGTHSGSSQITLMGVTTCRKSILDGIISGTNYTTPYSSYWHLLHYLSYWEAWAAFLEI